MKAPTFAEMWKWDKEFWEIMAKLTTKTRKAIPTSKFAGPGRSYPIEDKAHARNAKARAAQFASPALKARIDAKADKVLGKGKKGK